MNKAKKGRIPDETRWAEKDNLAGLLLGVLARRLLLSRVQRAVGKVGVHPSASIDKSTRRKRLKIKVLNPFQNGAILPSFGMGSALAQMGRDWGKPAGLQLASQEVLELQLEHLSKHTGSKKTS
jgi:hypothetical protein